MDLHLKERMCSLWIDLDGVGSNDIVNSGLPK